MRKTGLVSMLFALILTVVLPGFQASANSAFKDVSAGFWAEKEINMLVEMGVISGYDNGTFRPNQPVTRAQAAIMLTNALDLHTDVPNPNYHDVKVDHHAYEAIAAVTAAGIMSGSDNSFNPNKPLNRAQMATVLASTFELEGDGSASFKDVRDDFWAAAAIDAIYTQGITTGYDNGTFRPNQATTRAQFSVFLVKALETPDSESALASLLKEAYANEVALEAYDFSGNVEMGISLPASFYETDPELAMVAGVMEDITVEIKNGTYQKDPMKMEMDLAVTLGGDVNLTLNMPVIMTETKMWIKLPSSPFFELPPELDGKFIEFDMESLAMLEGADPTGMMVNLDLQTELALAVYDLFFDHFADGYYEFAELNAIDYPNAIDAKHVVKFELTNEKLESFATTFVEGFLPGMVELMADPEYADVFGITPEEAAQLAEELDMIQLELAALLEELQAVLTINTFEQYIVIDQNHHIAHDVLNLDVDFTIEGETLGLVLNSTQGKSRINLEPEFTYGIPAPEEVVPFEELFLIEEPMVIEQ
ncbi:S-layer homology domain-containing protein [Halalkalibacterium ligniniphilum]|uniref:S-layer homology domain-containing protein n=1 Tax=Halalkalibacterium ligniniphilum TaxID=1134413 RepID=UPI00034D5722|nr:S-layer homology domain-containing protein [Halalkalibacterium ligniniphilum]